MNQTAVANHLPQHTKLMSIHMRLLLIFLAGPLAALGFAPFHLPGLAILSLAMLFAQLQRQNSTRYAFLTGFVFGVGFLGLGVSWIYVSIHQYGHLNPFMSGAITALFVAYLSCFPGLVAYVYTKLAAKRSLLFCCFLFSALWCLGELLRATCFGGFPWLSVGFGQIDTPLKYILPIFGVYGAGFLACLAATCLAASTQKTTVPSYIWVISFVALLIAPSLLKNTHWTHIDSQPLSVGVIQANLSMRDKWDESLFWSLIKTYKTKIEHMIGRIQLIVLPESAITLRAHYICDVLQDILLAAIKAGCGILLAVHQPTSDDETFYYNTLSALGAAKGTYIKQHLVAFGEFIPDPFVRIINWLSIPIANLKPGPAHQHLVRVQKHPIATLICYELAYPELLRAQLPRAEWIVSISDDGWFGHSLAMYQHLQMAQVLSMLTGRYQIVANNDGLSSIIDTEGNLTDSLPAFTSGTLDANIYSASGATPWTYFGDNPALYLCFFMVLLAWIKQKIR